MKKFLTLLGFICLISACSEKDTTVQKTAEAQNTLDKDTVFSFDVANLSEGCDNSSEIVCAINNTIKCTLNPEFLDCASNKNKMPSFVFMQDDSLQRPTFQSYQIIKLVPRNDGAVEVYTKSSCNGSWFGLCNGNIIYVMKNIDSQWAVIDMYAVES
jgi:hypothetical protein